MPTPSSWYPMWVPTILVSEGLTLNSLFHMVEGVCVCGGGGGEGVSKLTNSHGLTGTKQQHEILQVFQESNRE